jgi:predicted aminopeptidase
MRRLLLAATALLSQGCFTASYLAQAARGEARLLLDARPLDEVLADPATPPRIRALLARVPAIKDYARAQGLRATRSYDRYADLGRPAAVWLVQACAPLSFTPRRWSFPVVGSVPYLGFFDQAEARRQAAALAEEEGLDVDVRTPRAWSTLGWFRDPVLSTMLPPGDAALGELANTILHESVHATVYVKDQSAFDESLASFVADRLTLPWLVVTLGPEADEVRAWTEAEASGRARAARLHAAWVELDGLYRSPAPGAERLAGKAAILEALQAELRLQGSINNATLAGYRTYDTGAEAFERLLEACHGRWGLLLRAVAGLRSEDFGAAQQEHFEAVLDRLSAAGCPAPRG